MSRPRAAVFGKRLLLIGGGGHCHSVLDSVLSLNVYDEIGIIDSIGGSCLGIPVIGTDDDVPALMNEGWNHAFITVGSVGDTRTRECLYQMVKGLGLAVVSVIDPTAIVAQGSAIKEGAFIGKRAVINTGATIGECSIINTGAIVEHGNEIGAFAHIGSGTVLCGQVKIGASAHIGAGTVARQQVTIGEHSLIGAGSVVVKDIPNNVKAYGNPCKVVGRWEFI